ncbi:MAG: hypothetical protein QME12_09350 [Nanoarchaeota archaeon]|nr:hypothetical protein [Nanoarchaeota archaeon]
MRGLKGVCTKALFPFSLAAFFLCSSPAFAGEAFNAREPNVLELDYEKGFKGNYSLSAKARVDAKGYTKGYGIINMNMKGASEVIEEDEGSSTLEVKINKVYADVIQDISGVKSNSKVEWNADKNKEEIPQEFFKNAVFYLSIDKTGEIECCDEEPRYRDQIIDLFPDEAVEIGDKWSSEGNAFIGFSSEQPFYQGGLKYLKEVTLKLSGKTKHKGRDALTIEFYGKADSGSYEDGEENESDDKAEKEFEEIKGKVLYDPVTKKILGLDAKLNASYADQADIEDEKTKTNYKITCEYSLKGE